MKNYFGISMLVGLLTMVSGTASAFECKVKDASMTKPDGFPTRALTMIVPYGPAGGPKRWPRLWDAVLLPRWCVRGHPLFWVIFSRR